MNAAGITKHISFHCARHTFGSLQADAGTSIYAIQRMPGHKNVETAGGTTYGEERTFTTPVNPAPDISAPSADEEAIVTPRTRRGIYTFNG